MRDRIRSELARFPKQDIDSALHGRPFLVVTFGNASYVEFIRNWHHHFTKLQMPNYLVVALDEEAHGQLERLGIRSHALIADDVHHRSDFANYGENDFNRLTARKILFVHLLLRSGLDVLLSDADTVWLRDPMPMLQHPADLQVQVDNRGAFAADESVAANPNINTGFYFARSNHRTVQFFEDVLVLLEHLPRFNDQNAFNLALRRNPRGTQVLTPHQAASRSDVLSVRLLDPLLFPNGSVYFQEFSRYRATGANPVMVHANWLHGRDRKVESLVEHGWWAELE